jgi:hypothetical protein
MENLKVMKRAALGVLAGVVGSVVGIALLSRWTRQPSAAPLELDPLLDADEALAEHRRMAEGIS